MDHFHYRDRNLFCEDVAVRELADHYGTPLYVYSKATLLHHLGAIKSAFQSVDPLICYSVKSNANLAICKLMVENGAGCDVTSGGELHRALKVGTPSEKIVFAGVGKTPAEMREALVKDVFLFNVESEEELHTLAEVAGSLGKVAPVALRVNPDLPPKTHVKTDTSVKGVKFGLDIETVMDVARGVAKNPNVLIVGVHMHLGSPILSAEPYRSGVNKAVALIEALRLKGHPIAVLNMGGGFGIHYRKREALPVSAFAEVILPAMELARCVLVLEPGRFIVGNAGILVSRVQYNKETGGKHYVIQDGAMNDLIRPTLYDAFHRIWPVAPAADVPAPPDDYEVDIPGTIKQDVVGPVCESGDYFAKGRNLPPLKRGDLLATFSAGAYGMSMASNYNSRPRAAEVMVDGAKHHLIRRRETFDDMIRTEVELK
jgi:diaminopimelate decarboxylase